MRASGLALVVASLWTAPAMAQQPEAAPPMEKAAGPASGRPANLCKELVAFLHPPAPEPGGGGPPPQAATAVQAPAQDKPVPKPADAGAPQQQSGQSGPIPNSGPGAAGPQGNAQKDSQAAPKPDKPAAPPASSAPKPSAEAVARGDSAAGANDIAGCRSVAQDMRRAGVAMPAPLLALAAMDPRLLQASAER
ncbi:hypothetical protein [Methylobacterium nigriterrae]|uniref:hypothetical protein n=1 Tax=Methylobacterium nigriterrae TaxID=3127512 RepID=UPI0030139A89